MTQQTHTATHTAFPWYAEVRRLLAKPFSAGQGVYREDKMVSVHMVPHQRAESTTVDLAVAIFPRLLPAPTTRTMTADRAALAAFLKELQDTDYHTRLAACEALGHLGDPEARVALQAAEQDAHQAVRAAATRALAALDTPRLQKEDLTGLGLVLVRHEDNLRQPLDRQSTDRRGHVWFRQVPAEAVCAIHMLSNSPQIRQRKAEQLLASRIGRQGQKQSVAWAPDGRTVASGSEDGTVKVWDAPSGQLLTNCVGHQGAVRSVAWAPDGRTVASGSEDGTVKVWDAPSGQLLTAQAFSLAVEELPAQEPRALGAWSRPVQASSLPQTQEVVLDDGRLVCILGRDTRGQVIIEFLSDAPQLQAGWVLMTVIGQSTQTEAVREFVPLVPYELGSMRGSYSLSAVLSPGQGYEIYYEPIPGLGDAME